MVKRGEVRTWVDDDVVEAVRDTLVRDAGRWREVVDTASGGVRTVVDVGVGNWAETFWR